jgi:hypothetical protein
MATRPYRCCPSESCNEIKDILEVDHWVGRLRGAALNVQNYMNLPSTLLRPLWTEAAAVLSEHSKMHDDLDDESAEFRDVCTGVGAALYLAQLLEHAIVNVLQLGYWTKFKKGTHPPPTKDTISKHIAKADETMEKHFTETMYDLKRSLRKSGIAVPDELWGLLGTAIERRNWLAHHIFRERALEMGSSVGRRGVIAEPNDIQQMLTEASHPALRPATMPLHRAGQNAPPASPDCNGDQPGEAQRLVDGHAARQTPGLLTSQPWHKRPDRIRHRSQQLGLPQKVRNSLVFV